MCVCVRVSEKLNRKGEQKRWSVLKYLAMTIIMSQKNTPFYQGLNLRLNSLMAFLHHNYVSFIHFQRMI